MQLSLSPFERARICLGALRVLGITTEPTTTEEAHKLAHVLLLTESEHTGEILTFVRTAEALSTLIAEEVDEEDRARVAHEALAAAVGGSPKARVVAALCGLIKTANEFGHVHYIEPGETGKVVAIPLAGMRYNSRTRTFEVASVKQNLSDQ